MKRKTKIQGKVKSHKQILFYITGELNIGDISWQSQKYSLFQDELHQFQTGAPESRRTKF